MATLKLHTLLGIPLDKKKHSHVKTEAYLRTDEIVSLFLNLRNRLVYVSVFMNTSENSCSSSALSFCAFRCSSNM